MKKVIFMMLIYLLVFPTAFLHSSEPQNKKKSQRGREVETYIITPSDPFIERFGSRILTDVKAWKNLNSGLLTIELNSFNPERSPATFEGHSTNIMHWRFKISFYDLNKNYLTHFITDPFFTLFKDQRENVDLQKPYWLSYDINIRDLRDLKYLAIEVIEGI